MRTERELRRADHLSGDSLRLAGPQFWTFPSPAAIRHAARREPDLASAYAAAIVAIRFARNDRQARKAEQQLAALLLSRNYFLRPAELQACLRHGDAEDLRNAVHAVAEHHMPRDLEPVIAFAAEVEATREPWPTRLWHRLAELWAIANKDLDHGPRPTFAP